MNTNLVTNQNLDMTKTKEKLDEILKTYAYSLKFNTNSEEEVRFGVVDRIYQEIITPYEKRLIHAQQDGYLTGVTQGRLDEKLQYEKQKKNYLEVEVFFNEPEVPTEMIDIKKVRVKNWGTYSIYFLERLGLYNSEYHSVQYPKKFIDQMVMKQKRKLNK